LASPPIPRESPEWPQLRAYIEERVADLQHELETPSLQHERTQLIRGQILELRSLRQLVEPDPKLPVEEDAILSRPVNY
jgi:hypothetical protein